MSLLVDWSVRNELTKHTAAGFARGLVSWFGRNARDLPWRQTRDPYAIWISEVMLQQTRVQTVVPYWERWMQQFPDIRSLASARPAAVLKAWEGLGYYARARNLQKAARLIVRDHQGRFPKEHRQVLELPGVGRYAAGAICSIAFNQPTPALDGNVIRVLTRLFAIRGNPKDRATNERLWTLASTLVRAAGRMRCDQSCGLLNQALMELGALICLPKRPHCSLCPLRRSCVARREDSVGRFPELPRWFAPTQKSIVAFVISDGDKFLVEQRRPGQVNARLWEFPNLERKRGDGGIAQLARNKFDSMVGRFCQFVRVQHSITRYRITVDAFCGTGRRSAFKSIAGQRWGTLRELDRLPFASAHRKILESLRLRA